MSELFHTGLGPDPAQGADVLASIRRLLAQDAADGDAGSRHAALRRRLIGLRRGSGVATAALPDGPIDLPGTAVPAQAPAAPPLRLADTQRVLPADAGVDVPAAAAMPPITFPSDIPPRPATGLPDALPDAMLTAAPGLPDSGGEADWPHAGDARIRELLTFQHWIADGGDLAIPATPAAAEMIGPSAQPSQPAWEADAAPQPAGRPAQAAPVPSDMPPHVAAETFDRTTHGTLPFPATRSVPEAARSFAPPSPLPQTVPGQPFIATVPRGDSDMGASPQPPGAAPAPPSATDGDLSLTALVTPAIFATPARPTPPPTAAPDHGAPPPAPAAADRSDLAPSPAARQVETPEDLRAMIRQTLLAELSGETGRHLSEAVSLLTRRAMAGALADLAREMGALHAGDGTDLH